MDRSSDAPVRIGFAGAGKFASTVMAPIVHALPGVVLQAVGARSEERARALNPVGRVHTTYHDLVHDPEVDAVYVVLSNDLHAPVVEAALRAGKPVLCEKPLALTRQQALHMMAVADECDQLLLEAFWYRWHPRQRDLEARVAAGEIGAVTSIDSGFTFYEPLEGNFRLDPQLGGGASYDVMCYAISFAISMLGDQPPISAEIESATYTDDHVDVLSCVRLTWADGAMALVTGGFTGPDRTWGTVVGTRGSATMRERGFSWAPEPPEGTVLTVSQGGEATSLSFPPCDGRSMMMSDFGDVVAGRLTPCDLPMSREHSLAVMHALDLVHQAMGRSVG